VRAAKGGYHFLSSLGLEAASSSSSSKKPPFIDCITWLGTG
jgi:hypothetical protein